MRLFRYRLRGRRVVVHTAKPDDQTISGVLIFDGPDRLVLEDAEYISSATVKNAIEHRVVIERARVSWLEEIGP